MEPAEDCQAIALAAARAECQWLATRAVPPVFLLDGMPVCTLTPPARRVREVLGGSVSRAPPSSSLSCRGARERAALHFLIQLLLKLDHDPLRYSGALLPGLRPVDLLAVPPGCLEKLGVGMLQQW